MERFAARLCAGTKKNTPRSKAMAKARGVMQYNFVLLGALLALYPLAVSAESRSCTDQDFIDSAVKVATESSSPMFGKIQVLDAPFNMRANPYFHTSPDLAHILADHDTQCVADVITNRSRMIMYYGWETINGKTYVAIKLVPRMGDEDDVSSPPPAPVEADPAPALNWEDVLPTVRRQCASKWRDDFSMQAYCIEEQRKGWEKLNRGNTTIIQPRPEPPPHNYTVTPLNSRPPAPVVAAPPARLPTQDSPVAQSRTEEEPPHNYPITPFNPIPPLPLVAAPTAPLPTQAFTDGRIARSDYESWVNGISEGEYRNGLLFWAAHRSDKKPPSCHYSSIAFESGCQDAQKHLASADARRKGEPDFRHGWNSL
jgi:hypothetical protein